MNFFTELLIMLALSLSIALPLYVYFKGKPSKKRYKKSLSLNTAFFFGIFVIGSILAFAQTGYAAAAPADAATTNGLSLGLGYLGAALATGLSGIGGGIAVASSANAALGAISEDGSIFGKSLIFVGLAEGIALYGLIISFMILGRL